MSELNHSQRIEAMIRGNKVFVFMKGSPDRPQCGFSAHITKIFKELGVEFKYFDVLEDEEMRQAIKDYTNWPTIPQIFIDGNFIGGSDILGELYQNGDLQKMLS